MCVCVFKVQNRKDNKRYCFRFILMSCVSNPLPACTMWVFAVLLVLVLFCIEIPAFCRGTMKQKHQNLYTREEKRGERAEGDGGETWGRGKEKVETEKTTKAKETNLQQYHAIKTVSKPLHSHLPPAPAITCPGSDMHTAIQEKSFRKS